MGHFQLDLFGQLQADGVAIEFVQLDDRALDEKVERTADHLFGEGEGLEGLLVEEVRAFVVGVEVGGLDQLQVRLLEALAGLEGLVEDGAGDQVAHLEPDQRLAAAGRGGGDLGFHAVVGGVLEFEVHLALDGNRFQQCGHGFLKRQACEPKIQRDFHPAPHQL